MGELKRFRRVFIRLGWGNVDKNNTKRHGSYSCKGYNGRREEAGTNWNGSCSWPCQRLGMSLARACACPCQSGFMAQIHWPSHGLVTFGIQANPMFYSSFPTLRHLAHLGPSIFPSLHTHTHIPNPTPISTHYDELYPFINFHLSTKRHALSVLNTDRYIEK